MRKLFPRIGNGKLTSCHSVLKNIAHLCSRSRSSTWGPEGWKKGRGLRCFRWSEQGQQANIASAQPGQLYSYEFSFSTDTCFKCKRWGSTKKVLQKIRSEARMSPPTSLSTLQVLLSHLLVRCRRALVPSRSCSASRNKIRKSSIVTGGSLMRLDPSSSPMVRVFPEFFQKKVLPHIFSLCASGCRNKADRDFHL